jgi:hypothetical protein
MKTEPTIHTSSAGLLVAPPYQPKARQTTQTSSSSTPRAPTTPPPAPKTPQNPPLTLLEKLKKFDATLDTYFPVIGNILEKMACALFAGLLMLALTGLFVVMPIVAVVAKVLEAWMG